ncbi:MAG: lipoyl(octanoyl) transferase LipB [Phycisphaerae bacterium]|nr:lipoyl(octanoyl) transferase LipB [Phycisphaerae bacterium]
MRELRVHDLGRIGYDAALTLQEELLRRVQDGGDDQPGHLLLLEHDPPVITLGRRGKEHDILPARETLDAMGVEIRESTRGGEVTYHGPGQLVGYAIHRLRLPELGVRDHVRNLEETVIRTLGQYGIESIRGDNKSGTTGVWTVSRQGDSAGGLGEKIAAIGVAVRRWVTYHGFALNVCTDLSHFDLIVPCGLKDKRVTSMTRILGREITVEEIKPRIAEHFAEVFGYTNVRNE